MCVPWRSIFLVEIVESIWFFLSLFFQPTNKQENKRNFFTSPPVHFRFSLDSRENDGLGNWRRRVKDSVCVRFAFSCRRRRKAKGGKWIRKGENFWKSFVQLSWKIRDTIEREIRFEYFSSILFYSFSRNFWPTKLSLPFYMLRHCWRYIPPPFLYFLARRERNFHFKKFN